MTIGIIGGGAAGFFAAIHAKQFNPSANVLILEKSSKLLSKVKISGGGRCNVTNIESDPTILSNAYPRGGRQLKKAFREFSSPETIHFFESRGVKLVVQEDGCIFPKSQSSQTIIDCFLDEAKKLGIQIKLNQGVKKIKPEDNLVYSVFTQSEQFTFDKLIICTGGTPKLSGFKWIEDLGQPIIPPLPSLFTFNMPNEPIRNLMGIVAPYVQTKIKNSKFQASGPLLITHWGMSGPAIIILSSLAARHLAECNYTFEVIVNWSGGKNEETIRSILNELEKDNPEVALKKFGIFDISQRLWEFLLSRWGVSPQLKWKEIGKKNRNKIINGLSNDTYLVSGKTTFKEEFVTAGGVDLKHINFKNMESKLLPNIHFAGEILDIDGITGGYNFQAAWTTGYLAGKGI